MKRITKQMKRLDLYASLVDIAYILMALLTISYLFAIMYVPERNEWTNISNAYTYDTVVGITITQPQMNVIISLLVGFLLVMVPLTVKSMQRVFDKKTIEIDEWTYRQQYLLAGFELVMLNPFSAAIRIMNGRNTQMVVMEYGMKQGLLNTWKSIKNGFVNLYRLFKRWALAFAGIFSNAKRAEAKAIKEQIRKDKLNTSKNRVRSQEELDDITRKDVIMSVARLVLTYGTLTITALFIFIPFYWMVITALKTYQESSLSPNPAFFIGLSEMQWVNFKIALTEFNFLQYIGNTIFVGVTTMIFTVLTTVLAAFAFSRLDFKGKDFMFSILLMTMMIPGELYTITNYITVSRLNWINTYYALIVPFSASVFYIFFLRQTFKQIPDTLYRAAKVDGSSDFKYLTRIMIPIASPTIITIIILSSIGAWDAYIWPQLVGKNEATTLVSVALRRESFSVGSGSDARPMYNMQLAATTIVTVPLLIVFFSLKKFILAGVGRSGTKG
jgi:ABC-type glycerol-3-phosphate transport system permease component